MEATFQAGHAAGQVSLGLGQEQAQASTAPLQLGRASGSLQRGGEVALPMLQLDGQGDAGQHGRSTAPAGQGAEGVARLLPPPEATEQARPLEGQRVAVDGARGIGRIGSVQGV